LLVKQKTPAHRLGLCRSAPQVGLPDVPPLQPVNRDKLLAQLFAC
jgi:hypothetical protein